MVYWSRGWEGDGWFKYMRILVKEVGDGRVWVEFG